MHLHLRRGADSWDLDLDLADPSATVADLRAAVDPGGPPGPLHIDGLEIASATLLHRTRLRTGSIIDLDPPGDDGDGPARTAVGCSALQAVRGLDVGRRVPLSEPRQVLGRRPDREQVAVNGSPAAIQDPSVSARHALVESFGPEGTVEVTDLGSTNGTLIDGTPTLGPTPLGPDSVLQLGRTRLRIAGTPATGPARLDEPPPLHLPDLGRTPTPPVPPGPLALIASVTAGLVLGLLLHSWLAASFALLGPVVLLAQAADGRRRHRRAVRRHRAERRRLLDQLTSELDRHRQATRCRREVAHPGPMPIGSTPSRSISTDMGPTPVVRIGTGDVPWDPPSAGSGRLDPEIEAALTAHRHLPDAPVLAELTPGRPLVLTGPGPVIDAVARSLLLQAAQRHPPAELALGLLTTPGRAERWDWTCWLPHRLDPGRPPLLAATASARRALIRALLTPPGPDPSAWTRPTLVLVDGPRALAETAEARSHAGAPAGARLLEIVLLPEPAAGPLPPDAVLVEFGADGSFTAAAPMLRGIGVADGIAVDTAAARAREFARSAADAEPGRAVTMPATVALLDLLPPEALDPAQLIGRWRDRADVDASPEVPLAAGPAGTISIDLDAHGPHLLVAGTTGAGKSELLRTLVASLALAHDPAHLTFVLVDFKGGSAFDACADLPHTVGVVTDLDPQLGSRVLRSLTAELRRRERALRVLGAASLTDARRLAGSGGSVPARLVVIVDEFATLAAEIPGFVDALVGLAQRGRSLGMHLVLATQRPGGVVSEAIRANIGARIALRTADAADSREVIDDPAAALLPRHLPGRAVLRLGPDDRITVQTASVSVRSRRTSRLTASPLVIPRVDAPEPTARHEEPTDLGRIVEAVTGAWRSIDGSDPRPVWPPALPAQLPWPVPPAEMPGTPPPAGGLVLGIADDPDQQCRRWASWHPDRGPLLVLGRTGQGTSTVAATVVLAAAERWGPDEVHIHVIEGGDHALDVLAGLPQVGAVIGTDDAERQRRLLVDLAGDLTRRRGSRAPSGGGGQPPARRIVVIDGWTSLRERWGDQLGDPTWAGLVDVIARGAAHGVHVVVTADAMVGLGTALPAAAAQRLVFALGDPTDRRLAGADDDTGAGPEPGRAHLVPDGLEVQVARPAGGLGPAVARLAGRWPSSVARGPAAAAGPLRIGRLPTELRWSTDLAADAGARAGVDGTLTLAVGIADADLGPATLTFPPGGHGLVAGPSRSGRTTAARTLALGAQHLGVQVVVVTGEPEQWPEPSAAASPAGALVPPVICRPGDAARVLAPVLDSDRQGAGLLVIVDDADTPGAASAVLERLTRSRAPQRHLVVVGRAERLRSCYEPWLREVRADRVGVLLQPDPDVDGDLLGTRVPRADALNGRGRPGRAWLVSGGLEGVVQVAHTGFGSLANS